LLKKTAQQVSKTNDPARRWQCHRSNKAQRSCKHQNGAIKQGRNVPIKTPKRSTNLQFSFEKLEVWQRGMDLVDEVYRISRKYPEREKFGLTNQLTRAATSVPLNIAEGSVHGQKEFSRFLRIAQGSLVEVITNLKIAQRQGFIEEGSTNTLNNLLRELYFKLASFQKTLKSSEHCERSNKASKTPISQANVVSDPT
jgi:four helix bundle protein